MTAEDRELLAHAIWTTGRTRAVDRFPLADALMPVVEAIARRRVVDELRMAACEVRANHGMASLSAKRIDLRADDLEAE